jgi:hypothetical protein
LRISETIRAWVSSSAWEKLSLRTSAPAAIMSRRVEMSQLAGPMVATILVLREARLLICLILTIVCPEPGQGSGSGA